MLASQLAICSFELLLVYRTYGKKTRFFIKNVVNFTTIFLVLICFYLL